MVKLKASEMSAKKISDLRDELKNQKVELSALRVAQVTNGTNSKLGKVKMVRKNIARVLTVINNKARDSFRSQLKKEGVTNERKPKQLRVKKTRAIRRALTKVQASKVTRREHKRATNFPVLNYFIKA